MLKIFEVIKNKALVLSVLTLFTHAAQALHSRQEFLKSAVIRCDVKDGSQPNIILVQDRSGGFNMYREPVEDKQVKVLTTLSGDSVEVYVGQNSVEHKLKPVGALSQVLVELMFDNTSLFPTLDTRYKKIIRIDTITGDSKYMSTVESGMTQSSSLDRQETVALDCYIDGQ